jgi:exonuclease SbcC
MSAKKKVSEQEIIGNREKLNHYSILLKDLSVLNKDISDTEGKIKSASNINLDDFNGYLNALGLKRNELSALNMAVSEYTLWQKELNKLMQIKPKDSTIFDENIEFLKREISIANDKEIPKCSNCGTPYEEYEKRKKEQMENLTNKLNYSLKNKEKLEAELLEHEKKVEGLVIKPEPSWDTIKKVETDIKVLEEKEKEYNRLQLLSGEIMGLKGQLGVLLKQKESLTKTISGFGFESIELYVKNQEEVVAYCNTKIREYEELKKINEVSLINLNNQIQQINVARDKIIEYSAQKKELEEKKLLLMKNMDALELLKGAFGNNGIRAILIDLLIPAIEDKINTILHKLSDFSIKINTQTLNTTGEKTVEGLFITIINPQNEEMDYDSYSGGEKLKIDMAIFEGLASLQKCNWRCFDESILGLDEETISSFINVMNTLQKNVSQVFMISHLPQIKDIFDHKILVQKVSGSSIIKVEK